jgi:hypothetical protein
MLALLLATQITFESHIKYLIRDRCYRCHREAISLEWLREERWAVAGSLKESKIYLETEGNRMPPIPLQGLDEYDLKMIETWITEGAQNGV